MNQGWNEERLQPNKRGVHALNEVDMISVKMDVLMKKIKESSSKKGIEAIQTPATVRAVETVPWCEVCRGDDHSGNNCPET